MQVILYDDEVTISADEMEEIGELNNFFLRNHTSEAHKGNAFSAKVMVTKSDGGHFTISIRFE